MTGLELGRLQVVLWFLVSLACVVRYDTVRRRGSSGGSWKFPVAAGVSALIATYSYGSGAATWMALIAVAIVARLPKRVVALLGLAAVSSMLSYTLGFPETGHEQVGNVSVDRLLANLTSQPLMFLKYATTLVGSVVGTAAGGVGLVGLESREPLSLAAGSVGVAGFATYALWVLLRSRE